ncbi:MAG TPA: hypothetical protein VN802_14495 [Stellaceae bacterium]|nr:hypothetical protein [Stellaceae bacterium]
MGTTPIDLYRAGDAIGPGLDILKPGDAVIFQKNGVDWVRAQSHGTTSAPSGVSSTAVTWKLLGRNSRWWKLSAGMQYPAELDVFQDHGNHWVWVPVRDMPLSDYVAALATLNPSFV